MAKRYTNTLNLEWYNKQKSILLQTEESKKDSDIPAPILNWVNKDEALFYEINEVEGKGIEPFWVDRNDFRIKESRPFILKKTFKAIKKNIKGSIPGTSQEFVIEESNKDDLEIENMLIKGDNLLALNSLKKYFSTKEDDKKIKCAYFDVPFNTGSAFEHYDDNLAHSEWLTLMRDRLEIVYSFLTTTGVLVIHLDDSEIHYLKVLLDSIFGRDNFICTIACKSSTPSGTKTTHRNKTIIKQKDLLLIYGKSTPITVYPQYIKRDVWDTHYSNFYNRETKKAERLIDVLQRNKIISKDTGLKDIEIANPKFKEFYLKYKDCIYQTQPSMPDDIKEKSLRLRDKIIEYKDLDGNYNYALNGRRFAFLSESLNKLEDGKEEFSMLLCDFWSDIDFQNTQNEGNNSFPAGKKPEKLLQRILNLFTQENDLVFDAFGGSGTTFSVAQKMKRKWIGIEIGKHMDTHILPRLKDVITGADISGISEIIDWKGGGSFKYYHLGPSIIIQKKDGTQDFNWSLGKKFIEESLLSSYDYSLEQENNLLDNKLFNEKDNTPSIGIQQIGTKSRIAIVSLNEPKGKLDMITYEEMMYLYKKIKEIYSPEYINIFTNRGIDIASDSKPEDLEVIKIPNAIFTELEK